MTKSGREKPPAPLLTRFLQLIGLVSIGGGIYFFIDAVDCEELGCLGVLVGGVLVVWGLVALASGIRNIIGFACLLIIIVVTAVNVWASPYAVIPFIILTAVFTRLSKGKIKDFYFDGREEAERSA